MKYEDAKRMVDQLRPLTDCKISHSTIEGEFTLYNVHLIATEGKNHIGNQDDAKWYPEKYIKSISNIQDIDFCVIIATERNRQKTYYDYFEEKFKCV